MMWLLISSILVVATSPSFIMGQLMDNSGGQFAGRGMRQYPLDLTGRISKPTCVNIPEDLGLCHGIGYTQMRMPNLLDHDTMDEVKHQAQSWIPLLLQQCHADTQLFLCALFAPVCLDRPIYPCRSLCEEVRAGCGPLMESNCFPWPAMLDCAKFPPDNDLCIKSEMREQNGTAGPQDFDLPSAMQERYMSLFTQCHDDSPQETLIQKYCTSDFVLKMKIKTIKDSKDGKKFIGDSSTDKLQIIKQGSLKTKDLKRLTFYVREGANCRCSMLDESGSYLLVMGHRDSHKSRKLFMTFVHSWHKTRDFRKKMAALKDPDVCVTPPVQVVTGGAGSAETASSRDHADDATPAQNAQGAETADMVRMTPAGAAEERIGGEFAVVQTNSPMRDGVSAVEQVMSDETPPTPITTPKGRRNRRRSRKGKSKRREQRQIEVRRAWTG